MDVIRTPDARFASLPGYPFAPRYAEVSGLRMHYVDEGAKDAPVVLLLHGEPSWSFLYRKMIPILTGAGLRAVAPDLVGFGKSDKPRAREAYSFQAHLDWLAQFLDAAGLDDGLTLFAQDWGGLLGLRLVAEHPGRFARVALSNTYLPTGDEKVSDAFRAWRAYAEGAPELPVGKIVASGCATPLSPEVIAAYDAPFPDEASKAGARMFPLLVPIRPDDPASEKNRAAWQALERFEKPVLTAFGDKDPITRGADRRIQERIPGCKGQAHVTLAGGGHFIQEDKGEELAAIVAEFVRKTR